MSILDEQSLTDAVDKQELLTEVDKQQEAEAGVSVVQVGPQELSGYGDQRDRDRVTDVGFVADIKPVKGNGAGKTILTPTERADVIRQVGENTVGTLADQVSDAADITHAAKANPLGAAQNVINAQEAQQFEYDLSSGFRQQIERERQQGQEYINTHFGDQVAAAWRQNSITEAMKRWYYAPDFDADPNFDGLKNRDQFEQGLPEESRQYLRESRSDAELQYRLGVIQKEQADLRTLGVRGSGWALAAGLTAGAADLPGWILGAGVGKTLQIAGMGSMAAYEAGNIVRGAAYATLEGAAANVLTEAALDAAGGHVTYNDYLYAAALGGVMNHLSAFNGLSAAKAAQEAGVVRDIAGAIDETLMDGHVQLREARARAQAAAGKAPNADVGPGEELVPDVQAEAVQTPIYDAGRMRTRSPQEPPETTAHELLDGIANGTDDPILKAQAQALKGRIGDDIGVVISDRVRMDENGNIKVRAGQPRAWYDAATQQIYIHPRENDFETQLHEITHAVTYDRMRFGDQNPDSAIGKLTSEIGALYDTAVQKAQGRKFNNTNTDYFLSNRDEFVAGLFSGTKMAGEFHDFLKGITIQQGNLLSQLANTVRRILGFKAKEHNAFLHGIGLTDKLVDQPLNVKVSAVRKTKDGWSDTEILRKMYKDSVANGEQVQANSLRSSVDDLQEAQTRASPEPTAEQIKHELDNLQRERFQLAMNIIHAPTDPINHFLPVVQGVELGPNGMPVINAEALPPRAELEAAAARWGIDASLEPNDSVRLLMSVLAKSADDWNARNPVDPGRINTIIRKAPWLASTGIQLASSQNPLARMVAGVLLESSTGAFGRGRTAAIDKELMLRQYNDHLAAAEEHYTNWRNRNGGGLWTDIVQAKQRSQFYRMVSQEMENQRIGVASGEVDPDVLAYAKNITEGYNRMRIDQQARNVIGAARLGDSSVGYVPRRFRLGWVLNSTPEMRMAVSRKIAAQLEAVWGDADFANQIAARYMSRVSKEAAGGVAVPANVFNGEGVDIVRELLESHNIPAEEVDRLMGRFSRGGANYTKTRLDLDLNDEVQMPDGTSMRLGDAFEQDHAKLYRMYANRASGEVALANYGVYGAQGLMLIRNGLEYGPNGARATAEELAAFDQITAEFLGRAQGKDNKTLGTLRMLAASSRLGGMGFQQFAEIANGVGLYGLSGAATMISSIPRLIQDVRLGRESKLLRDIELIGGRIGNDHRVVFPYQDMGDEKVFGAEELTAFDRMMRSGAQAVPWLSGWHYLHAAQQRGVAEQIVMKSMRYINGNMEDAALTSLGITPTLRARLQADLPNIAKFDATGRLEELNLTQTKDPAAVAEYVQAVHRGSRQIIQGTFIGETGKWAHDDLLKLLTQFRSFSLISMEKQWTRQRNDFGTIKAFGLLMGSMAFALPIHLLRVQINSLNQPDPEAYLEQQLQPALLARNLLNYPSMTGLLPDVLDASAGVMGYSLSGGRSGGGDADLTGAVPALGYVNSLASAVKNKDPHELIRSLPGGNLPFLVPLVNTLKE